MSEATPRHPAAPAAGRLRGASRSISDESELFGRRLIYAAIWSLQLVTGAIVSPFLAHILTPAQFGLIASALALHQLLDVVTVLGLDQAIIVQHAEDDSGRAARGLVTVGFAVSTLASVVLGLTAVWWGPAFGFGGHYPLVLAVVLWTGPSAAVRMMLALLSSEDRLGRFSVVTVLSTALAQVVGFIALLEHNRLASTYAWALVAVQCIAMLLGIGLARPRLSGLIEFAAAWRAIKFGTAIALSGFSSFILNAGDRIILQREKGPVDTGRYQVAYTVGYVLVLLWIFVAQSWAPRLAAIRDEPTRIALMARARNQVYRVFVPGLIGLTLITPTALRIVAPPEYHPNSLLLIVFLVAVAIFPVAATGITSIALVARRQARPLGIAGFSAAAVNIVANLVLIPPLGIAGSALATIGAFGLQAVLLNRFVGEYRHELRIPRALLAEIVAASGLCALTILIPQTFTTNLIRDGIAAACLGWFVNRLRAARRVPDLGPPAPT